MQSQMTDTMEEQIDTIMKQLIDTVVNQPIVIESIVDVPIVDVPIVDVPIIEKIVNKPIEINFSTLREERQKINNNITFDAIKQKDKNTLYKVCNELELQRILDEEKQTLDQLLDECENNNLAIRFLARTIAKKASRQGSRDELTQLQVCNQTSSKYGIIIESLPNDALRPCKDGSIVSKQQFKLLDDKNSCLKSFDAEIKGKKCGYVFAKVVFGNGGHQDNVFEEAHTFCDWVCNFGNPELIYVVLIDTDLTNKFDQLKEKFQHEKKILIANHINFQKYFIDNY